MVFGFSCAVLVGFLLTAVQNWTSRRTVWGLWLALLAGVWLVARLSVLGGASILAAVSSNIFLIGSLLCIGVPIAKARNYRNLGLVAVVFMLLCLSLSYHLRQTGLTSYHLPISETRLALAFFGLVITLMAGRVIPAFTQNAIPAASPRKNTWIEIFAFLTFAVVAFAEVLLVLTNATVGIIALIGVAVHLLRLWMWEPWCTKKDPLLWILPVGYLWIPIYLACESLYFFSFLTSSTAALHALTAGAIGCLMIGMMTRSARGHTGRQLKADYMDCSMYVLVITGAIIRVFGPLIWPHLNDILISISGVFWAGGFFVFFIAYFSRLTKPRLDSSA